MPITLFLSLHNVYIVPQKPRLAITCQLKATLHWAEEIAELVGCLPNVQETLGFSPSTPKPGCGNTHL